MPNQKYNQQGGREAAEVNNESEFWDLYQPLISKMEQKLPPAIPLIQKKEITQGVDRFDDKRFKINTARPDEHIYKYGQMYKDIHITQHIMELLYNDRQYLYFEKKEHFINITNKNLKEIHDEKNILQLENYYKHIEKIFKIYVPMRDQLFPGYSKHVRQIKYTIKETEGTKETTSNKPPQQKKTEQILRNFLFMFNQPDKDSEGKSIFENFNMFLKNGDNIDELLKKVEDDTAVKESIQKSDNDAFKLISIFAWEESGKLLTSIEKMEEEEKRTENQQEMMNNDIDANTGNILNKGGGEELVSPDQEASRQRRNRRIVIFICLVSYFCHGWLLITQFFRISSFITRIMDLRQQYINDGIGDFGETDDGNLFFSTYNVLWQLMSIGMVQVVVNIQQRSMTMAQNILDSTIDEARIQNMISWDRGIATYVNDLITGGISGATAVESRANVEAEFALMTRNILRDTRHLQNDARSVHAGLVNSINGIITTTTVLLHMMNPRLITSAHVSGSIAQYTSAVFNPTTTISGVTSISNATALMSRLGYVYLYGYESQQSVPTFSQPGEEAPTSEPSLMIRDGDINQRVDTMLDEHEGVENLLNFFNSARQEAAAQEQTETQVEESKGGSLKRKKGKKSTYKKRVGGSRRRSYRKKSN